MKKPPKTDSQQPVHKIRHSAVSASIWQKQTEKGVMYNVTFQRAYKDGDEWKNSGSFGRKDLLVLGLIAARSFEWIATQSQRSQSTGQPQPHGDDVPF